MNQTGRWVWDVVLGAPTLWSADMCRIHGRTVGPVVPSREEYRSLFAPDDWFGWQTALDHSIANRTAIDCHCRLTLSDGVTKRVRITGDPVVDSNGAVTAIIGSTTEITTEDHAAVDTLSDNDYRRAFDLIPVLAWSSRADGSVDFFNRRFLGYTGLAAAEALEWGWTVAIHPDDLDRLVKVWQSVLLAGAPGEVAARLRRFDGDYRWFLFQASPMKDAAGAVTRWYGTNTDIEDVRTRAEQSLLESRSHLQGVLEIIPALIFRSKADGRLDYVSRRVIDYLGLELTHISDDIVHPDDREIYSRQWTRALSTGEAWENVYRLRRRDGRYCWFYGKCESVRDAGGHVACWYAVNVDIDDRMEAEEALRVTRARLSEAMRIATVAELSASIAHEINQPLASVVTNGQACQVWLAHEPPNLDRARATLERIIRDGRGAADVVSRIRALFKQAAPAKGLLAINDVVREVLELMSEELRVAAIKVETTLAPDLPMTLADGVQIQQTLINLVHNAIDAMEDVASRRKVLSLGTHCDGPALTIHVHDQGRGLTDPTAIFDPFVTTKESGMGMGLAICRSIIEAHDGRLWASSNHEGGATFTFTLPLVSHPLEHPRVSVEGSGLPL